MVLGRAFSYYKGSFKAALAFALLLVFVPLFSLFEGVFVSSGSMFFEYDAGRLQQLLLFFPVFLLYLAFYSLLVSVIVFSVRRELSKLKLHFYLREMIQNFAFKLFVFFALTSLLFYGLALAMLSFGFSVLSFALILLVVSLALLFVPQAVVIDEEDLWHAVLNNFEFISRNPKAFLQVVVVGCVLLVAVAIVGELVDRIYLVGAYVSLLLSLVFVLPFVEVLKTYLYMLKFDLIKSPQLVSERAVAS